MASILTSNSSLTSNVAFNSDVILPSSISNLIGWWDASANVFEASGDPAENNDFIFRWIARDSGAKIWEQGAVTSARPFYRENQINGLPAIQFAQNATENRYFTVTQAAGNGTDGSSIFFVVKYSGTFPSNTNNEGGLWRGGSNGAPRYPNSTNSIGDNFWSITLTTYTPTKAINEWRVLSARGKTNLKTTYIDNALQYSSTSNSYADRGGATAAYLGFNVSHAFVGYVAEVIWYSRYITDQENIIITTYLKNKYALSF